MFGAGWCSGLGANPYWTGPPQVEQLSLTSVRVSWHGLLQRQDCADNILVKHFRGSTTSDYKISELLSVETNSLILAGLNPNQPYTYQVRQRIQ